MGFETEASQTILGTTLHWAEAGRGRPLVLLHGLSDSHRTWQRVVDPLAAERSVYALDLAGHGLSGRPDASYDLAWHASLIGAWIDRQGFDEFDLVGHSFGGGVAQFLLLTHARRVRRLGLVAPGGLGPEVSLGLRLLSLPGARFVVAPFLGVGTGIALSHLAGGLAVADRHWAAWANSAPGTARALTRSVRGVIDLGGQHRHFLDHAGEVDRLPPVAVYWGERDPILPIDQAYRATAQISEVELTTFSGCGHFPHLEQPEAFLAALNRFLDDGAARRARIVVGAMPPTRSRPWSRAAGALAAGLRRCFGWLRPRRRPAPLLAASTPAIRSGER